MRYCYNPNVFPSHVASLRQIITAIEWQKYSKLYSLPVFFEDGYMFCKQRFHTCVALCSGNVSFSVEGGVRQQLLKPKRTKQLLITGTNKKNETKNRKAMQQPQQQENEIRTSKHMFSTFSRCAFDVFLSFFLYLITHLRLCRCCC